MPEQVAPCILHIGKTDLHDSPLLLKPAICNADIGEVQADSFIQPDAVIADAEHGQDDEKDDGSCCFSCESR